MSDLLSSVRAINIPDAWFQCVSLLIDKGFRHTVERGSFEGETRLEFDHMVVQIDQPYAEPYDSMLPEIPAHYNIPDPVAKGYVEQYVPYLMTDHIEPGEQYTYGSRIFSQVPYWTGVLRGSPGTNQAILQVARPEDCYLPDPPCLRHIDMRVKNGVLIFYPYFRSWDLWAGFPANLAGIAVLQKSMADAIGVKAGPIIACSKGLHVYGYAEEIAKIRANKSGV